MRSYIIDIHTSLQKENSVFNQIKYILLCNCNVSFPCLLSLVARGIDLIVLCSLLLSLHIVSTRYGREEMGLCFILSPISPSLHILISIDN